MFVYVTGGAGSGKSAVAAELRRRGIDAFDEDDPQVGSAHDRLTGRPVRVPPANARSPEWFAQHEWRLRDGVLDHLRRRSLDGLVVLCGSVFSLSAAVEEFDRVLVPDVEEQVLRQRIIARVGNDYGKTTDELNRILDRHRALSNASRREDVVTIDATLPLPEVADDVVEAARRS